MNWEDESYVRVYKRDTITWKLIGWQGRCLLPLLLRKVDRAGCLDTEGAGAEGIAALVDVPVDVVEPGLQALIDRGVLEIRDTILILPKFVAAQEAKQSDKQRQIESRGRRRAAVLRGKTKAEEPANHPESHTASHPVTNCDTPSRSVTERHTASHGVTSGHSVKCSEVKRSEVNSPKPPKGAPSFSFLDALKSLAAGVAPDADLWAAFESQKHSSTTGLPMNVENAWTGVWAQLAMADPPPSAVDMEKLGRWWARGGAAKCKKQRFNYLSSVERFTEWIGQARAWDGVTDPTPDQEPEKPHRAVPAADATDDATMRKIREARSRELQGAKP